MESIKVVCRIKPHASLPSFCVENDQISLQNQIYSFDTVYPSTTQNHEIFENIGNKNILSLFEGYNSTILTYGQTASGKTHTIQGSSEDKGILPRAINGILQKLKETGDILYNAKLSIFEIYKEKINDLISAKENLVIREDKNQFYVQDLAEVEMNDEETVFNAIKQADLKRNTQFTDMNDKSSRSHLLFQITLYQQSNLETKKSKLFIVDLAGSERIKKSGLKNQTLQEGKMINLSLSLLGNVINKLSENQQHIPYRDSKLTKILHESLGGNSKTTLIVTVSALQDNQEETKSSLQFGQRAKNIKNKAVINKEESVQELQKKVKFLQCQIEEQKLEYQLVLKGEKPIQMSGFIQQKDEQENIINVLNQDLVQANGKNQKLKERNKNLKTDYEEILKELQHIQIANKEMSERKNIEKSRSTNELNQNINNLQIENEQLKTQIIELNNKLHIKADNYSKSKLECKEKEKQILQLLQKEQILKEQTISFFEIKNQLNSLQNQNKNIQNDISTKNNLISQLQQKIQDQSQSIFQYQNDITLKEQLYSSLEQKHDVFLLKLEEKNTEMIKSQTEMIKSQKEIQFANEKLQNQEREFKDQKQIFINQFLKFDNQITEQNEKNTFLTAQKETNNKNLRKIVEESQCLSQKLSQNSYQKQFFSFEKFEIFNQNQIFDQNIYSEEQVQEIQILKKENDSLRIANIEIKQQSYIKAKKEIEEQVYQNNLLNSKQKNVSNKIISQYQQKIREMEEKNKYLNQQIYYLQKQQKNELQSELTFQLILSDLKQKKELEKQNFLNSVVVKQCILNLLRLEPELQVYKDLKIDDYDIYNVANVFNLFVRAFDSISKKSKQQIIQQTKIPDDSSISLNQSQLSMSKYKNFDYSESNKENFNSQNSQLLSGNSEKLNVKRKNPFIEAMSMEPLIKKQTKISF